MAILAFRSGGSSVKYGVWTGKELTNQGSFPTQLVLGRNEKAHFIIRFMQRQKK